MGTLDFSILLSMISQKQSISFRKVSVSQERLEIKNQKEWVRSTLAVCTCVEIAVISEKQSSFSSKV